MKPAFIKLYVNAADPSDVIAAVKANVAHSGGWKTCLRAKTAAEAYASQSSYHWWKATVNAPWRGMVVNGAPIRYEKLNDYNNRLARRVLKLLKAKGMK